MRKCACLDDIIQYYHAAFLFVETVPERGCTFVTCPAVIKCTARRHIYELISDGTRANVHLFVTGNIAVNDSPDQTNFRYTRLECILPNKSYAYIYIYILRLLVTMYLCGQYFVLTLETQSNAYRRKEVPV